MTSFVKAGGSYGSSKASQQSVFTSASELETAMLSVKQIELKGGPLTLAGPFDSPDHVSPQPHIETAGAPRTPSAWTR
jgi:hypothetical protein